MQTFFCLMVSQWIRHSSFHLRYLHNLTFRIVAICGTNVELTLRRLIDRDILGWIYYLILIPDRYIYWAVTRVTGR